VFGATVGCVPLDVSGQAAGVVMGFLSRLFVPRGVRRTMHPGRAVRRALTPKMVKRAHRSMHPVSNASYSFQRSLNTKKRRGRARSQAYRHGSCPVKHRTVEAANRCRRG